MAAIPVTSRPPVNYPGAGQRTAAPAWGGTHVSNALPPGIGTPGNYPLVSGIPGAGVYAEQQAQAQLAWEQAQTQLLQQRNTAYHQYGLNAQGGVDPFNQYGNYQQLLGQHEQQLAGADELAQQRGLGGGPGLGMQGETALRYPQGAEDLQMQHDIADISSQYTQGMQGALSQRNAEFLNAQIAALSAAVAQGMFSPAGGNTPFEMPFTARGYSGDQTSAAAAAYAAAHGYSPHMVMQEGTITYKNGKPGFMVKYNTPSGTSTEWTPLS